MQVVKHQSTKRTYRPRKDSQLREFSVWIQDEDWSNVLSAENIQQKADVLYESLWGAIDRFFPMQTVGESGANLPHSPLLFAWEERGELAPHVFLLTWLLPTYADDVFMLHIHHQEYQEVMAAQPVFV